MLIDYGPVLKYMHHAVGSVSKGPRRNLRNDLLIAADSITSTMSSLVKELNSGQGTTHTHLTHLTFDLWSAFIM